MNNLFEPEIALDEKLIAPHRGDAQEFAIEDIVEPDARSRVRQKTESGVFQVLYGLVIVIFGILIVRTAYLKTARHDYFVALAEGNRHRIIDQPALRGVIVDRSGVPLVENKPASDAGVVKVDLPHDKTERARVLQRVAQLLQIPDTQVQEVVDKADINNFAPALLKENLSHDEAVLLTAENLPGVVVQESSRRDYLEGVQLSHILGYTARINKEEYDAKKVEAPGSYLFNDFIGRSGIESAYESALKGHNGKEQVEVDAVGRVTKVLATTPAQSGDKLTLTIDLEAQKKLSQALQTQLDEAKVKNGAAVAMNPQNGEVVALVSLPNYDLNAFANGISQEEYQKLLNDPANPLFDSAVSGSFPPGSTFKPYVAAAGLNEGVITPSTTVLSTGKLTLGAFQFLDYKPGGHGITNLNKAIAQSVNTYFYYVGGGYQGFNGLGITRIGDYASKFGFGVPTGIELPGEARGLVPTPEWKERVKNEQWYIGDTYHTAIGQGDVTVSPLQLAQAFSTIANGGKVIRPHLLKSKEHSDGTIEETQPEIVRQDFLNPSTISAVQDAVAETVRSGSGRALSTLPVSAAGKTGTAQFVVPNSGGRLDTHAWFTSYAPLDNPQLVVVVLVEGGGEGHEYAVPVAKEFMQWYFTR